MPMAFIIRAIFAWWFPESRILESSMKSPTFTPRLAIRGWLDHLWPSWPSEHLCKKQWALCILPNGQSQLFIKSFMNKVLLESQTLMAKQKNAIPLLLTHWSYSSLVLNHQTILTQVKMTAVPMWDDVTLNGALHTEQCVSKRARAKVSRQERYARHGLSFVTSSDRWICGIVEESIGGSAAAGSLANSRSISGSNSSRSSASIWYFLKDYAI